MKATILFLAASFALASAQQATLGAACYGNPAYCGGSSLLLTCRGGALATVNCLQALTTPSEGATCVLPAPTANNAACFAVGAATTAFPNLSGGLGTSPGSGPTDGGSNGGSNGGSTSTTTTRGSTTTTSSSSTTSTTSTTPSSTTSLTTSFSQVVVSTLVYSTLPGTTIIVSTAVSTSSSAVVLSSAVPASNGQSSGLSSGAKIGIGVGVGVGGVALIAFIAIIFLLRRRRGRPPKRHVEEIKPRDELPPPPVSSTPTKPRVVPPKEKWGGEGAVGGAETDAYAPAEGAFTRKERNKNPELPTGASELSGTTAAAHPPAHPPNAAELPTSPVAGTASNRRSAQSAQAELPDTSHPVYELGDGK